MNAQLPVLSWEQHQLLQLVLETFRETGGWPSYLYIEKKLDSRAGADLYETGRAIRGTLIAFDPHRSPSSQVMLPVAGIARCDGAAEDLDAFVATLRWLVACERDWQPSSPSDTDRPEVSSTEARAALRREGVALGNLELAMVGALAREEGLFDSSSHQPEEPWIWSGVPARTLRDLRDVGSVEEYLAARRVGIGGASAVPAYEEGGIGEAAPREETVTAPSPEVPYLFILMPFGEEWSDAVRETISRTCARLENQGTRLECERADEIARPGRITQQIIESIKRADVIVADITGNNANVMFELGYADALDKLIVVLNQNLAAAPFDIKDWRAIAYSVDALGAAEQELGRAILAALSEP
jgi:hypothetical protein